MSWGIQSGGALEMNASINAYFLTHYDDCPLSTSATGQFARMEEAIEINLNKIIYIHLIPILIYHKFCFCYFSRMQAARLIQELW
jgi:hypothetical protein